MILYILIAFAAVILTAIAQVLLKYGANYSLKFTSKLKQYLNIYTISGYFLFYIVTIMNVYAYKFIPLKYAIILLPFTFIFITILSYIIFKEIPSRRQKISYIIIIIGIFFYNLK